MTTPFKDMEREQLCALVDELEARIEQGGYGEEGKALNERLDSACIELSRRDALETRQAGGYTAVIRMDETGAEAEYQLKALSFDEAEYEADLGAEAVRRVTQASVTVLRINRPLLEGEFENPESHSPVSTLDSSEEVMKIAVMTLPVHYQWAVSRNSRILNIWAGGQILDHGWSITRLDADNAAAAKDDGQEVTPGWWIESDGYYCDRLDDGEDHGPLNGLIVLEHNAKLAELKRLQARS